MTAFLLKKSFQRGLLFLLGGCLVLSLASCGGGGGNPGTTTGTGTGTGTGNTASTDPQMKLVIVDGSGAEVSMLSGGQSAIVRATVTTASGTAVPKAIVSFKTSVAGLVEFSPSGSTLTGSNGIAEVTIKPSSFTVAGALSISADSVVEGKTATASAPVQVGAAPLIVGALSFTTPRTSPLAAFNTVSLNIPVTSGGQPVNTVVGLTLTSLCVADGKATLVSGSVANGIQSATYTNNGCSRGTDTLTASIGNSSKSISLDVISANIGTIKFIGSNISGSSIVLKGAGGLGRSEAAQLTFQVVDQLGAAIGGVDVSFRGTTTTGGLTVSPAIGTTDNLGNVSTTVSSGTIPTPVRVVAEATRNGSIISGLSDTLTISTGLPIQKSMSMSVDKYNIEGLSSDGEIANITVRMADQYGNPVSDNTAISFVTEGGAVGSSLQGACTTVNGVCDVALKSQAFRPTNGRVTVLAYAQGIEDFVDLNGDGQYSCTNFTDADGNFSATYRPMVDICVSGGEPFTDQGDAFLDAGSLAPTSGLTPGSTLDGVYDPSNGDLPFPYNHATYSSSGNGRWGLNYINRSVEVVFSGSDATLIRQVCSPTCRDWIPSDGDPSVIQGVAGGGCSNQLLTFRLIDVNNNPLPAGTTVSSADIDKVTPQTFSPAIVASTNLVGGTLHSVNIKADPTCAVGSFSVKVATPKGTASIFLFKSN